MYFCTAMSLSHRKPWYWCSQILLAYISSLQTGEQAHLHCASDWQLASITLSLSICFRLIQLEYCAWSHGLCHTSFTTCTSSFASCPYNLWSSRLWPIFFFFLVELGDRPCCLWYLVLVIQFFHVLENLLQLSIFNFSQSIRLMTLSPLFVLVIHVQDEISWCMWFDVDYTW